MGIDISAVTGEGIKFIVEDEIDTLIKIIDYFTSKDKGKRLDFEKAFPIHQEKEDYIFEALEYLPDTLEVKIFGNTICDTHSNPVGVMFVNDIPTIMETIDVFDLDKEISNLAEVEIG